MPSKTKQGKGTGKGHVEVEVKGETETENTAAVAVEAGSEPTEAVAETAKRSRAKNTPKEERYVGSLNEEGVFVPFKITDEASCSEFINQFKNIKPSGKGGFETHFVKKHGCTTHDGVNRLDNQGNMKVAIAHFEALACRAAMVGTTDHGLSADQSPEEAEHLLEAAYNFVTSLCNGLEAKRAEIAERKLAAQAAELGISVEDLKAIQAKRAAETANA